MIVWKQGIELGSPRRTAAAARREEPRCLGPSRIDGLAGLETQVHAASIMAPISRRASRSRDDGPVIEVEAAVRDRPG